MFNLFFRSLNKTKKFTNIHKFKVLREHKNKIQISKTLIYHYLFQAASPIRNKNSELDGQTKTFLEGQNKKSLEDNANGEVS